MNVYKRLGLDAYVASKPEELAHASKIILPGVGSFDGAMNRLNTRGFIPKLERLVLESKVPFLGVCVGMQVLAQNSEEGELQGLGWIQGRAKKLEIKSESPALRLPHMGWNSVLNFGDDILFNGLNNSEFYFLHSYYVDCKFESDILANFDYGSIACCAIKHENIYGVQFHPEKSHDSGAKLLKNFSEI
jgi:glutamine amidotransferase